MPAQISVVPGQVPVEEFKPGEVVEDDDYFLNKYKGKNIVYKDEYEKGKYETMLYDFLKIIDFDKTGFLSAENLDEASDIIRIHGTAKHQNKAELNYKHLPKDMVKVLTQWDADNTGSISITNLILAGEAQKRMHDENRMVKKFLVLTLVVVCILLGGIFGLAVTAAEMAKDSKPDDTGVEQMDDGTPVATGGIMTSYKLEEFASFDAATLSTIDEVSFFHQGIWQRYKIASMQKTATGVSLEVGTGKWLKIGVDKTVTLDGKPVNLKEGRRLLEGSKILKKWPQDDRRLQEEKEYNSMSEKHTEQMMAMRKKTGPPPCGCPTWSQKWMPLYDEKKHELEVAMHGRRLQKLPDEEVMKRMKILEGLDDVERALLVQLIMEDADEQRMKEVLQMAAEKEMTPEESAWFLAKMKEELATEPRGMRPPCGCPKWMAMQKVEKRRLQTDKEEEERMKKAQMQEMLKDMDKGERAMYLQKNKELEMMKRMEEEAEGALVSQENVCAGKPGKDPEDGRRLIMQLDPTMLDTYKEMEDLKHAGEPIPCSKLVKNADYDMNGMVDMKEFMALCMPAEEFMMLDEATGSDGFLSVQDCEKISAELAHKLGHEALVPKCKGPYAANKP
jgi:Ca2+-binding EF-hand superfamily protein